MKEKQVDLKAQLKKEFDELQKVEQQFIKALENVRTTAFARLNLIIELSGMELDEANEIVGMKFFVKEGSENDVLSDV